MKLQKDKRRRLGALVALLATAVALVALHYEARRRGRVSLPEEVALTVLTPLQGVLTQAGFTFRERFRSLQRLGQLEKENRELRQQVAALKASNRRLERYFVENKKLRKLLGLDLDVPGEAIFAEVISMTTSNWFQRVRIDRGWAESVRPKDVVLTDAGLVGQVVDTDRHTATVQLLIDRQSGVAARIKRYGSRATGVVRGLSGPECELAYLERDADVRVGDQVITSGRGEVYPPGLIIGEVTAVHKDRHGTRHFATVRPAADFATMEEVYIRKRLRGAR